MSSNLTTPISSYSLEGGPFVKFTQLAAIWTRLRTPYTSEQLTAAFNAPSPFVTHGVTNHIVDGGDVLVIDLLSETSMHTKHADATVEMLCRNLNYKNFTEALGEGSSEATTTLRRYRVTSGKPDGVGIRIEYHEEKTTDGWPTATLHDYGFPEPKPGEQEKNDNRSEESKKERNRRKNAKRTQAKSNIAQMQTEAKEHTKENAALEKPIAEERDKMQETKRKPTTDRKKQVNVRNLLLAANSMKKGTRLAQMSTFELLLEEPETLLEWQDKLESLQSPVGDPWGFLEISRASLLIDFERLKQAIGMDREDDDVASHQATIEAMKSKMNVESPAQQQVVVWEEDDSRTKNRPSKKKRDAERRRRQATGSTDAEAPEEDAEGLSTMDSSILENADGESLGNDQLVAEVKSAAAERLEDGGKCSSEEGTVDIGDAMSENATVEIGEDDEASFTTLPETHEVLEDDQATSKIEPEEWSVLEEGEKGNSGDADDALHFASLVSENASLGDLEDDIATLTARWADHGVHDEDEAISMLELASNAVLQESRAVAESWAAESDVFSLVMAEELSIEKDVTKEREDNMLDERSHSPSKAAPPRFDDLEVVPLTQASIDDMNPKIIFGNSEDYQSDATISEALDTDSEATLVDETHEPDDYDGHEAVWVYVGGKILGFGQLKPMPYWWWRNDDFKYWSEQKLLDCGL